MPDKETIEKNLNRAIAASNFLDSDAGKLIIELLTEDANRAINDITSRKYVKDHNGYLARLADLRSSRNLIRRIQAMGSRDYIERLKKIEKDLTDEQ